MNTLENKELLRGIFERMARGDVAALGAALADDCRWVFPGNWSWSGVWEPKTEVLHGLLRPLMTQFADGYRMEADFLLAEQDRVVVQARGYGLTRRGDDYHQTYCLIFRLADGRITEIIEHCDTALVERVLDPILTPPIAG
ncbi:nuclear transport factor 2 family protein [Nocardia acidivorans]|uniref:nuclear transport factor 2 family protein n=1 Tax=Nocardia acidivorans TaxID=404580 RepID=UPI00082B87A3|nr:nuclear transport factor 2 family protein [Nocardia acidivorans]